MKESVLGFACEGESLVGILAEPDGKAAEVGVLIIVGGPQYRAGSHRQFVLLARDVAAAGYACLRFDYRGMGDSGGDARDFTNADNDVGAAIAALLHACPYLKRVVLAGLCDGASAALLYLHSHPDPRVQGLVLLNPWVRSEAGLAQTQVKHYYLQRLLEPGFWRKLLTGGVGRTAMQGLLGSLRLSMQSTAAPTAGFQACMASAAAAFQGPLLVLLSSDDYTAREFAEHARQNPAWQSRLAGSNCTRLDLAGADHTLSVHEHLASAYSIIVEWLKNSLVRQ